MRRAPTIHPKSKARVHLPAGAAPVAFIEEQDVMPDTPFEEGARDALEPDLRHRMISEAAYHLYARRGYTDGYDLDDWLQAEAQVDHVTLSARRSEAEAEAAELAGT
ncbi:MAG TPA: DUF2934 domain-containing protein [Burkholderiales bacterium]|nr:DUF2934 domain-containing protein [Burkholderiales bacterium]